jgi:hypothetical protein
MEWLLPPLKTSGGFFANLATKLKPRWGFTNEKVPHGFVSSGPFWQRRNRSARRVDKMMAWAGNPRIRVENQDYNTGGSLLDKV